MMRGVSCLLNWGRGGIVDIDLVAVFEMGWYFAIIEPFLCRGSFFLGWGGGGMVRVKIVGESLKFTPREGDVFSRWGLVGLAGMRFQGGKG